MWCVVCEDDEGDDLETAPILVRWQLQEACRHHNIESGGNRCSWPRGELLIEQARPAEQVALEQPSNADETAFTSSNIAFTLPVSSRHESELSRLEDQVEHDSAQSHKACPSPSDADTRWFQSKSHVELSE